jgi:hypothetical protein
MSRRRPFTLISLLVVAVMCAFGAGGVTAQGTGMSVTVQLQQYDNSGISGTAVLTETTTGGTHVSMILVGATLNGNHPTHIHTGTCDNFDPNPLYPLETVNLSPVSKDGISETDVEDVDLATLHTGKYVILVHLSPDQLTNYLVCGEISGGTVGTAALVKPNSTPATHHMPITGTGPNIWNESQKSEFVALFCALACVSAVTGRVVRKGQR